VTDATLVHEQAETASATTAVTGRHLPALNGLRGLAVIGVVAYHLQIGWARGGYLGVDLFFVLSGFLITTLLLEEWVGTGRVDLGAFWGRRARRLLPALFLVVLALALYLICNAVWGGPGANGLIDLSGLRGDAVATLLYVNNWHLIFAHQSYFAQFSTPSPLQHTWSLAIEEQFYLVWPLLLGSA
jgi:peptidoglycan/LPS O-acetylase OafA/YrhL